MLEIEKNKFDIKFSEMNIRQRMYQGESFITLQMMIEFFPSLVGNQIVSGAMEIKLDTKDIHALKDLENKKYNGDIGMITISVNNNGVWEHQSVDTFSVLFGKINGREIEVKVESANTKLETDITIVSLYTTSTDRKKIEKIFNMEPFYDAVMEKKIGNSTITKYFVKA